MNRICRLCFVFALVFMDELIEWYDFIIELC